MNGKKPSEPVLKTGAYVTPLDDGVTYELTIPWSALTSEQWDQYVADGMTPSYPRGWKING